MGRKAERVGFVVENNPAEAGARLQLPVNGHTHIA